MIAAWIALKFEPPPETKTAKRFFGEAEDVDGEEEPISGGEAAEARMLVFSDLFDDTLLLVTFLDAAACNPRTLLDDLTIAR
jgi:hypothetical protein